MEQAWVRYATTQCLLSPQLARFDTPVQVMETCTQVSRYDAAMAFDTDGQKRFRGTDHDAKQ